MKNLIVFILISIITGCSSSKIYVKREIPAKLNLKKYETIAIDKIEGDSSLDFTTDLNKSLLKSKRFKILERNNVDILIKEHAIGQIKNKEKFDLRPSSLIIAGKITKHFQVYKQHINHTCYDNNVKYPCTIIKHIEEASIKAGLRLISSNTGELLFSDNFFSKTNLPLEDNVITNRPLLEEIVRLNVIDKFLTVVQPTKTTEEIKVFEDSSAPELEQGNEFAKIEKWDLAIEKYNHALNNPNITQKAKGHAYYLLGVAKTFIEKFDEAKILINKAYSNNQEEEYLTFLNRIKTFEEDFLNLKKQQL